MTACCSTCAKPLSRHGVKTGLCGQCWYAARRLPDRSCEDCAKPISKYTKSGLCNACSNRRKEADPEFHARRAEAIRRSMADPARRARAAKVLHRNLLNAMEDPEFRQRLVERGKRLRWTALETPQAKANLAAVRAENGRKRTETVLAWCPPEHRDHYFHLSVTKRMPAAEAKRLVLDHIAREQRRETAKLTPFERQMAALKNGGTLYDFGGSNVQL